MLSTGYVLYFENAAVRVLEHPIGFAIFQYKLGPRAFTDLESALVHVNNLLHRRQWYRVLNDQRQMVPFSEEEITHVSEFWRTHLNHYHQGICVAVLMAHDVFARLAASQMRHYHQTVALTITYRLFEDEAEAAVWLRELPA